MKEDKGCKKVVMNFLGSAHDKFSLNVCNSRINLINVKCKPCIISYYVGSDSNGKFIGVYGAIIVEVLYYIEREYRKHTQIFLTTFSKDIQLGEECSKIKNINIKMKNIEVKRINEFSIVGFFTLQFSLCMVIKDNDNFDTDEYSCYNCKSSMEVNDEENEEKESISTTSEFDYDDMDIMIKSFDEFMNYGDEAVDNVNAVYNFNPTKNKSLLPVRISINNDYYKQISSYKK